MLLQISQNALIAETDYGSSHSYGELIDLLLAHTTECSDALCICGELEKFYDLLKLGKLHNNQEVFPMIGKQFSHFKSVIQQHGLQGTFSGITNYIKRGAQISESTS